MLRKSLNAPFQVYLNHNKNFHGRNAKINPKNMFNPSRQAKAIEKLFGARVSGSKKRWYPTQESTKGSNPQSSASFLNVTQFGKSTPATGGNKSTLRRMTVLNKLFMEHITDLMATGEASETLLGHGLQVTRVKISPDFDMLNIYWLGKGEITTDAVLEQELKRCAGVLRHELSQLKLIGEVPHIKFVRDKQHGNINQVEDLLRTMDFSQEEVPEDGEVADHQNMEEYKARINDINLKKAEFFGKISKDAVEQNDEVPEMRHDVFGLDHRLIMSKIATKMRKSKMAWDMHHKAQQMSMRNAEEEQLAEQDTQQPSTTRLERVQERLAEVAKKDTEEFDKFLANRRERKRIPERKRHQRMFVDWTTETNELDEAVLSPQQRRLMEAEDYLYEEHNKDHKV